MFALGLLLVLLGAALVAAEAHVPSHGALGAGAVAALATGVALLLSAAGSATLVAVFAGLAVAASRRRVGSGVLVRKALGTHRLRETATRLARAHRCGARRGLGVRGRRAVARP